MLSYLENNITQNGTFPTGSVLWGCHGSCFSDPWVWRTTLEELPALHIFDRYGPNLFATPLLSWNLSAVLSTVFVCMSLGARNVGGGRRETKVWGCCERVSPSPTSPYRSLAQCSHLRCPPRWDHRHHLALFCLLDTPQGVAHTGTHAVLTLNLWAGSHDPRFTGVGTEV